MDGTPLTGNNMVNYFNKYFVNIVSSIISHTMQRPLHTTIILLLIIHFTFFFIFFQDSNYILKLEDKPCSICQKFLHLHLYKIWTVTYMQCNLFENENKINITCLYQLIKP